MQFLDPFPEHSGNVPNSDDNVTLSTSSSSSSDITLDSICEEMVESIFCEEEEFLDSEKHNEKCYIGIASTFNDTGHILYANSIQCSTFFQYDIFYLYSYLHEYSIFDIHSMRGGNIDIMKLIKANIKVSLYVDVIIESRNHEINSITEQKFKKFKQDQS